MPIHDWTKVPAGIFHHFHHSWIEELARVLNRGLLPGSYYALAEQITGAFGPDVLALEIPQVRGIGLERNGGDVALATKSPRVRFRTKLEEDRRYAMRAKAVVVRHTSGHDVVAMIEIVSPGNKSSQPALDAFVRKAQALMVGGVHLLIVDLFPPGPRDPLGLHALIWETDNVPFPNEEDKYLSCIAYRSDIDAEVFLEPAAVGDVVPEMPLFLTPETYINVPLDAAYQAAWEAVPAVWRETLASPSASGSGT